MLFRQIIALVALAFGTSIAAAQQYPNHMVKIIVAFTAGGPLDVLTRALAAELATKWGQPVIIENRVGASGNPGTESVAKAPADGYTLLSSSDTSFTANRYLYKSLPYDPERSFVPITLMAQINQFLLAHPSVSAMDLRELVALSRREPGKLSYGSWGRGSQPQLVYEMVNKNEGLDLLHVPYKGVAQLLPSLLSGEIQLAVGSSGLAGALLKAGRLKALAIAAKQRSPQFPGVPTSTELGYPYVQSSIWFALFAPAGTPAAIVEKIGADARAIMNTPAFAERQVTSKGMDVVASTSQQLVARIRAETASVGEMVRAAGIQAE